MFNRLYDLWLWILKWLTVTRPARVAVLMVLAVLVFLIVSEQGQDVVRALAERQFGAQDDWQRIFFFGGVLAWSLYAWYWARVMLRLAFPGVPGNEAQYLGYRTWMPRALGTLAALGVSLALARAAAGYAQDEHAQVRELLEGYAFWCLMGAIAFFFAASFRRAVLRFVHGRVSRAAPRHARAVRLLDVCKSDEEQYGTAALRALGAPTLGYLAAAILAALLLLLVFVFALQSAAPAIGSAAILILAATGWIAAGSALDILGMRRRVPAFLALFGLAVLLSPFNDNHAVRTLPGPQPDKRADLRAMLRDWMRNQPPKAGRYPIYLVNAEGGGIRAAWWTASVLGEIQGTLPQFGAQLFSLSGVSGGSLGASVFTALLAEQRAGNGIITKQMGQRILGEDFLSPVAAAMLYPDLVQRLLPFPVPHFDRALALEQAWERAWRRHMPGRDRLAEPMEKLREGAGWAPLLLLNATWVETGKRLVASQAAISAEDFVDTEDAQAFFAPQSLRLSTAAHMSARFTYVSPAGTLTRQGRAHGRVVDGGYFENSAATTTLEVALTINALAEDDREDPRCKRIEPIVIHISNEPASPDHPPETLQEAAGHPRIGPGRWMPELLSPLWSLLSTREARGTYARETLRLHVGEDNFFHFGLCRESTNPPLGWVLSSSTRRNMNSQLAGMRCETQATPPRALFDNRGTLERLRRRGE